MSANIIDLLEQDEYWVTATGERLRVVEMEASHRSNLLRFLRRRAEAYKFRYEIECAFFGPTDEANGEMAVDVYSSDLNQLMEQDAAEWLETFPLVRRLARLVEEAA